MITAAWLFCALLLDAIFGEPKWLWGRFPHPAVLMGRAIDALDRTFNKGEQRRLKGLMVLAFLVLSAWALGKLVGLLPFANLITIAIAAMLLAQKSLVTHVRAVALALRLSLNDGRLAVSMIVGRDISSLDEAGVARGAIESAAENLSDGVIAPAFWFLLGGLPGILIYKITNTADSMIGHRTPRHEEFGWATARFDDLLNLIPARLCALLIALSAARLDALAPILRDAPLHRSPNAGWPEAAMAVVLNLRLSGPRSYNGQTQDFPYLYPEGANHADASAIETATQVLWRSWAVVLGAVALLALF
ncbi:MAG: adenosylcobinamide-phosphate synthase CbiB [Paracoccaceae bacterium]|nr:adenosylcobinamide-phosphate synthase CbiB [Paracoccaceae bacterium]